MSEQVSKQVSKQVDEPVREPVREPVSESVSKPEMKLEVLVSARNQDVSQMLSQMNLPADARVCNQCERYAYEELEDAKGNRILCYHMKERGVGRSRNTLLQRAEAEIVLFSDEDIVYYEGVGEKILQEFARNPKADAILFNMDVCASRATYRSDRVRRVRIYNSGRYPTYSFAMRRSFLHNHNLSFSLLFGGGAAYSNGEDSLFLRDCLREGMKIYTSPLCIGREEERESTWFQGYNEKFFYDRGVLYRFLYGKLAPLLSLRFLLAHKNLYESEVSRKQAFTWMRQGIHHARRLLGK